METRTKDLKEIKEKEEKEKVKVSMDAKDEAEEKVEVEEEKEKVKEKVKASGDDRKEKDITKVQKEKESVTTAAVQDTWPKIVGHLKEVKVKAFLLTGQVLEFLQEYHLLHLFQIQLRPYLISFGVLI